MNAIAKQAGVRLTSDRSRLLSLATLEKWLSPNDRDHVPGIEALEVFMLAVNTEAPLECWARSHGSRLVSEGEAMLLEYGRAKFEARERARRMKRLEEDITDLRNGSGR